MSLRAHLASDAAGQHSLVRKSFLHHATWIALRALRRCSAVNAHGHRCTRGAHPGHEHWIELGGGIADVWTH